MLVVILFTVGGSSSLRGQITEPQPFPIAFERGEVIRYKLRYSMIPVGKARFEVQPKWYFFRGQPHYHFHVRGWSLESWDMIYKVRDHYHAIADTAHLQSLMAYRDVHEGPYRVHDRYFFLPDRQAVRSMRYQDGDTLDTTMQVPQPTYDLVTAIYHARGLDFSSAQPGDKFPMVVYLENEAFSLGVTYQGQDTIETDLGVFRCLVIRPELVAGRVFKGQEDMTVYVTDDRNKIPVLIETAIFIGRIRAEVSGWEGLKYPLDARLSP